MGSNGAGCLGLGDMQSTLLPRKVEALCNKVTHEMVINPYESATHKWFAEHRHLRLWQRTTRPGVHTGRRALQLVRKPFYTKRFFVNKTLFRGHNGYCQLGNGSTNQVLTPTLVQGSLTGRTVVMVACGSHHSICLTDTGDIFAWYDDD